MCSYLAPARLWHVRERVGDEILRRQDEMLAEEQEERLVLAGHAKAEEVERQYLVELRGGYTDQADVGEDADDTEQP